MCGILGNIKFNDTGGEKLNIGLLTHRGPDGYGEWNNAGNNVYFGHTRLAILEPTPAGFQPMTDSSKRFTITFNGEIYNHLELRALLPDKKWNGSSDTETLLQLLAVKGLDAINLLKGMFAFALYDAEEKTVTLVRDRLGIKPLWIKFCKDHVSFSSEIRVLTNNKNPTLTSGALSEYVGFGRMPGNGEIFKGIETLAPGSWLTVAQNGEIKRGTWWPGNELKSVHIKNRKESIEVVKKMVTKAIEEHLISDVGVGAFLSGGIDSSIVTLVAGRALGQRLQTFTVGFPQGDYDERKIARTVAKQAGTEHFELEVTEEDCLQFVKEAVESLDLPSVDAINTYIVSKAVRDTGLKVALSGLGGDELFGGYPSFKNVPYLTWLAKMPAGIAKTLVGRMPKNLKDKLEGISDFSIETLTTARRRFTSVNKLKDLGLTSGSPFIAKAPDGLDDMARISWAEIQGYTIPMLLRDSDQMSMAVGLEIRVPFFDHELVENVLSMQENFKKGNGVKPLLVEAFKDILPAEVYDRPKQGFVLPMKEWLQGPLLDFTNKGIESACDITGLTEPLVQKNKFINGELHWTRVWQWSVLGHWLERQKEKTRETKITV